MKSIHNIPTSSSAAALEHLFELAVLLTDAMERGLAGRGLTRARAELLWRLSARSPQTQRELSQALRCTPRNVTDLVDALEAAGLVARGRHPTDRRATLVTLTERGKDAAGWMQDGYRELGAGLYAGLPADELAAFGRVVDRLLERLRQEDPATVAVGAPAPPPPGAIGGPVRPDAQAEDAGTGRLRGGGSGSR